MSEYQKTRIYALGGLVIVFLAGYAHARIKSQEDKEKAFMVGWGMRGAIGAIGALGKKREEERGEG